ncbi:alpha/beta hydrolase [Algoriphagus namhaensis]|uniref:Alpha/beta hydrolase n=1 Tax=Algoriphagus namhaensis TaxID=915353 RepID=A0ABV8AS06_9BACT
MKKLFFTLLTLFSSHMLLAQNHIIPLWEGTPPLQKEVELKEKIVQEDIVRISNVQTPTLEVYLPAKSIRNGQAVLIFPGGGYRILAYDWEGTDFAKWLNTQGIVGIVVKYRLPDSPSLTDPKEVPLLDAQRAMRMVRYNAEEWGINPEKVGVMGFSAGGHLASTLSTQYDHDLDLPKDTIDELSARPDFSVLVYPVISFRDKSAHSGSSKALIGENPSQDFLDRFSGELNVNADTPPTFLVHAQDDKGVPVRNSLLYYEALTDAGVPASMHLYPTGGHGFAFGLGKGTVENWRNELLTWLKTMQD